jgi:hypothetical protein
MKPGRWSALAIIFFFCFSVFAPLPLSAMEPAQLSAMESAPLSAMESASSPKMEEEGLKTRASSFTEFFKNDWTQTKKDFFIMKIKLLKLRQDLVSKKSSSWDSTFNNLKENLLEKTGKTIDELGPRNFHRMVFEVTGQAVLPSISDETSDQVLAALMMKEIHEVFDTVCNDMAKGSREELESVLNDTETILNRLKNGETEEELAASLKKDVFAATNGEVFSDGPQAPGTTVKASRGSFKTVFKAVYKTLMAVFMCAAVGAIGLVSLGFLSAAIAGGSIVFGALGGAATIACVVGVIKYIKEGFHAIKPGTTSGEGEVSSIKRSILIVPSNFEFQLRGAY